MDELTFNILKIVISLATALITAFVIPYLKSLMDEKKYDQLLELVHIAVQAAEQSIKGDGQVKKAEVMDFLSKWLTDKGIKITVDQLDQLVEWAVYEMNRNKEA